MVAGGERVKNDHGDLAALQARCCTRSRIDRQSVVVDRRRRRACSTWRDTPPRRCTAASGSSAADDGARADRLRRRASRTASTRSAARTSSARSRRRSRSLNDRALPRTTLARRDAIAGHGRGGEGRAGARRGVLRLARGQRAPRSRPATSTPLATLDRAQRPSCTSRTSPASGDPFELGSARPLDFGHWAAHKLEIADRASAPPRRGRRDRHGARHAATPPRSACSPARRRDRIVDACSARLGLPIWDAALRCCGPGERPRMLDGLAEFREHLGGELTVTLLTRHRPRRRGARDARRRDPAARSTLARRPGRRGGEARDAGAPHLTYCTNIHPGETWAEVRGNLERHVLAVQAAVAPDRPLRRRAPAVGAAAARRSQRRRASASCELPRARTDLYVFTINGFPYGAFHGARVKEQVYAPGLAGRAPARLHATAWRRSSPTLLPADAGSTAASARCRARFGRGAGSPATARRSPSDCCGTSRRWSRSRRDRHDASRSALEPEPWCVLETVADAVAFFGEHLFSRRRRARLAALHRTRAAAERGGAAPPPRRLLRRLSHGGRVRGSRRRARARLAAAGIAIVKVQVSAGMVRDARRRDDDGPHARARAFADDVYLHQVVERRGDAAPTLRRPPGGARAPRTATSVAREWRIHFHVPLFREALGLVAQHAAAGWPRCCARSARAAYDGHLEVETYTVGRAAGGVSRRAGRRADRARAARGRWSSSAT